MSATRALWEKLIAQFCARDTERLLADGRIGRSRAKIEVLIGNARDYLAMHDPGEGFADFVWRVARGTQIVGDGQKAFARSIGSETMSPALKQREYKFVGPMIIYAWMQACGRASDHETHCLRRRAP